MQAYKCVRCIEMDSLHNVDKLFSVGYALSHMKKAAIETSRSRKIDLSTFQTHRLKSTINIPIYKI